MKARRLRAKHPRSALLAIAMVVVPDFALAEDVCDIRSPTCLSDLEVRALGEWKFDAQAFSTILGQDTLLPLVCFQTNLRFAPMGELIQENVDDRNVRKCRNIIGSQPLRWSFANDRETLFPLLIRAGEFQRSFSGRIIKSKDGSISLNVSADVPSLSGGTASFRYVWSAD